MIMVDLNKIILPDLNRFISKKSLLLDKKSNIKDFELIISIEDMHIRYTSDNEAIAVGEYIKKVFLDNEIINHGGKKNESFIYIERIDDKYCYAVYIKRDSVVKELLDTEEKIYEVFNFFSKNAEVFVSDENDLNIFWDNAVLVAKADIENSYEEFSLLSLYESDYHRERVKNIASGFIGLFFVLGIGLMGYKYLNPPPPPPPPPPPHPVVVWKNSLADKLPLKAALNNMANALSYFYLLPNDWVIVDSSIENKEIVINIAPTGEQSKKATLDAWIDTYPRASAWFDKESLTFTLPLKDRLQEKWYRLSQYPNELYDELLSFGASSVIKSSLESIGKVERFQYSVKFEDVPYATLTNLAALLSDKPITLDELNIQQSSSLTFVSIDTVFTLEGIN